MSDKTDKRTGPHNPEVTGVDPTIDQRAEPVVPHSKDHRDRETPQQKAARLKAGPPRGSNGQLLPDEDVIKESEAKRKDEERAYSGSPLTVKSPDGKTDMEVTDGATFDPQGNKINR